MEENTMKQYWDHMLAHTIAAVPTPGADATNTLAPHWDGLHLTEYRNRLADACLLGKTGLMWDNNLNRTPLTVADLPVTNVSLPYIPQ